MRILRRPQQQTLLLEEKSLPTFLAQIYANRGIEHLHELSCSLNDLLPYHSLKNIDEATDILSTMLLEQKRFLIIGDFDADGATASVIAVKALKMLGAQHVDYLVPNRFEYGYGLTPDIVKQAQKRTPDIIITVDNGISSIEGVEYANTLGIPVLVTDHHLAGRELPNAIAIVNPNQPECDFPSKALAGCGVIFYVMLALRAKLKEKAYFKNTIPNLAELLDIVALGTVADVVPLDKNNRILVRQGVNRIRKGFACPGIQALIKIAGREASRLNTQDLGFALGPRLNAAGRLEDMSIGIECLLSDNLEKALLLAEQLDVLNAERKTIEADMQLQANELLKTLVGTPRSYSPLGISLYDPSWHPGVVGILASRVKEAHHRPVICFAKGSDGLLKGSARSVSGVHIRDILDRVATENPGMIIKFGGHAMAAGLTIEEAHYATFSHTFANTVSHYLKEEDCQGVHWSDGALQPTDITPTTAYILDAAGPFGAQFPMPLFDNTFTVLSLRAMSEGKHMRYHLTCEGGTPVEAVQFGIDPLCIPIPGQQIHIAYTLELNHYKGEDRLQLRIMSLNIC